MNDDRTTSSGISRRRFLGRLGAGAVAVGAGSALRVEGGRAASAGSVRHQPSAGAPAGFGRIFDRLPPFADAKRRGSSRRSSSSGRRAGSSTRTTTLARGPVQLITDPSLSVHNPDNPTHTAGTTFMGQFIDHDMTFDVASPLGMPTAPIALAERPHAVVRPRLGLRRAGRSPARSSTTRQTARS